MKSITDTSDMCWECTGAGTNTGGGPCRVCHGTGKLDEEQMRCQHISVTERTKKALEHQMIQASTDEERDEYEIRIEALNQQLNELYKSVDSSLDVLDHETLVHKAYNAIGYRPTKDERTINDRLSLLRKYSAERLKTLIGTN